jgi:hypothetical protein
MTNQIPTGSPTAKLSNGAFNTPTIFSRAELLQGFTDADNDPLNIAFVASENGTITENINGTFTFSPDKNFSGAVSLDYVVSDSNGGELNAMQTFTISGANQIPTGNATAKLANGKANAAYTINAADLIQGFTDANNDALRVSLLTAENGEISDNNNGTFTFSPDKDFNGLVMLDYVVSDNNGGELNATQTFNLTANGASMTTSKNNAPSGSATTKLPDGKANTAYTVNNADLIQGFTDADNDALQVSLLTAENGEISDNNNGTFTFSPDKDFNGLVMLDYVVSDNNGGELNASLGFNLLSDNVIENPVQPIEPIIEPVQPIENPDDNHRVTGEIVIEGTLKVGKTLSLLNSLDDEDGVGDFNYQWFANGQATSNASKETYKLT